MRKRPGRHRAGNFARAVDGSASPHSSVTRLVSLANALRNVPLRNTAPDSSVRQRLMAEAACPQPVERQAFWAEWLGRLRLQRGLATTTVLATVLLAAAGIGFGTTQSLPGDTLYAMKLRSETVQLALVGSAEERGRKNLEFADSRLDEIARLVQHKGAWPQTRSAEASGQQDAESVEKLINRTFDTMDASTAAGARAMRQAFERTGDTRPLAYLGEFVLRQQSELRDIMPKLPSGSQAAASDSLAYADELGEETTEILGTPSGCTDGSCTAEDQAASSSTDTPSEQPSSSSPSGKASSSTSAGHTDTSTSTEPPATSSTSQPTTGTGSDTGTSSSDGTSGTGTSSDSGTTTSTPSRSGDSTSGTQRGEPTEPTSTSSPSPSSTPPSPTGVPTKPSGTKDEVSSDTGGDRHSSPPAESDSSRSSSPPAESSREATTNSSSSSSSSSSPPAQSDSSSSSSSSSQSTASGTPSGGSSWPWGSSDEPEASPSGSASRTGG